MAGAAIGGAAIGAALGGMTDMAGNLYSNAASRSASRKAFKRYVYAYSNRYRWTMEDMARAGLNPMLVAGIGGAPGSVGMPAAAKVHRPDSGAAVRAARQGSRLAAELDVLKSTNEAQQAQATRDQSQAAVNYSTTNLNWERMKQVAAEADRARSQERLFNAQAQISEHGAVGAEIEAQLYQTGGGELARQLKALGFPGLAGAADRIFRRRGVKPKRAVRPGDKGYPARPKESKPRDRGYNR